MYMRYQICPCFYDFSIEFRNYSNSLSLESSPVLGGRRTVWYCFFHLIYLQFPCLHVLLSFSSLSDLHPLQIFSFSYYPYEKESIVQISLNQSTKTASMTYISPPPTKGHPSYQTRFQIHQDSKILVNCPPQERPPPVYDHIFIAGGVN